MAAIKAVITADADQLIKELKRAQGSIDRLKDRNQKLRTANQKAVQSNKALSGSFGKMAGAISPVHLGIAGATTAIATFATSSVKSFVQVEKQWAEVTTLMKGRSKDFTDATLDELRDFAVRTGTELGNAAQASYQAISAGIRDTNLVEFLEVARDAALGGVTELDVAVDGITTALNAYGLEADEATRLSDAMFTAVRLGKTTFEEMAPAIGQVLPLAKQMGVGFEQVTAAIAVLTSQGASTSEAVTRIRGALVALSKETKARDLFEDFSGKTIPEFIREGGNLQQILQIIKDEGTRLGIDMPSAFGRVEGALATFALSGPESLALFDEAMSDTADATENAAAKMEETTAHRLAKMKASFDDFKLDVGEVVIDVAEGAVSAAQSIVDAFKDIPETITVQVNVEEVEGAAADEVVPRQFEVRTPEAPGLWETFAQSVKSVVENFSATHTEAGRGVKAAGDAADEFTRKVRGSGNDLITTFTEITSAGARHAARIDDRGDAEGDATQSVDAFEEAVSGAAGAAEVLSSGLTSLGDGLTALDGYLTSIQAAHFAANRAVTESTGEGGPWGLLRRYASGTMSTEEATQTYLNTMAWNTSQTPSRPTLRGGGGGGGGSAPEPTYGGLTKSQWDEIQDLIDEQARETKRVADEAARAAEQAADAAKRWADRETSAAARLTDRRFGIGIADASTAQDWDEVLRLGKERMDAQIAALDKSEMTTSEYNLAVLDATEAYDGLTDQVNAAKDALEAREKAASQALASRKSGIGIADALAASDWGEALRLGKVEMDRQIAALDKANMTTSEYELALLNITESYDALEEKVKAGSDAEGLATEAKIVAYHAQMASNRQTEWLLKRQEQIDERERKAKEYAIWLKEEEARKTAWRIRRQEGIDARERQKADRARRETASGSAFGRASLAARGRAQRTAIENEEWANARLIAQSVHSTMTIAAKQLETEGEQYEAIQQANDWLEDTNQAIIDAEASAEADADRIVQAQKDAAEHIAQTIRQTQADADDALTQALLAGPAGEEFGGLLAQFQAQRVAERGALAASFEAGEFEGRSVLGRDAEGNRVLLKTPEEIFRGGLAAIERVYQGRVDDLQARFAADPENLRRVDPDLYVTIKSDDRPDRRVKADAGPVQSRPRRNCV